MSVIQGGRLPGVDTLHVCFSPIGQKLSGLNGLKKRLRNVFFILDYPCTQVNFLLLWTKWSIVGSNKRSLPHACSIQQTFSEATNRFSFMFYWPEEYCMLMPEPKSWQRNGTPIISLCQLRFTI